jgi:hypothetical protein
MINSLLPKFALLAIVLFSVGTSDHSLPDEPTPIVAINLVGSGKFKIVIVNVTEHPIRFGGLWSELGFDQFHFVCNGGKRAVTISRKNILIASEFFDVEHVAVGGFCLFDVDLFDGSWELGGLEESSVDWKLLKVIYQPESCHALKSREANGIYSKSIESLFVKTVKEIGIESKKR